MLLWAVYQDGRPLRRGLTRADADRQADFLARGYESHRAGNKRRVAEFEVKPDYGLNKELDDNWKLFKEGVV